MARTKHNADAAVKALREFGLGYPGAHIKSPWPTHMDLAVNNKTFAYLSTEGEPFGISCKLPQSNAVALMLPFTKPAAYGLGKSGWVSASPPPDQPIPIDMFKEWLDESYRAQAPKKLIAQLTTGKPPPAAAKSPPKKPARKPSAPRKPPTPRKQAPKR